MVTGGDRGSRGCEFESRHRVLDGSFLNLFAENDCVVVRKDEKKK